MFSVLMCYWWGGGKRSGQMLAKPRSEPKTGDAVGPY